MDELAAMVIVFGSGVVIVAIVLWHKARQERLALLEKALSQPNLDDVSRQQLIGELTGRRSADEPSWKANFVDQLTLLSRNALFVAGWITMFVGVGCVIGGDRDMVEGGIVAAATGFGLATIPLALRELQGRTQQS